MGLHHLRPPGLSNGLDPGGFFPGKVILFLVWYHRTDRWFKYLNPRFFIHLLHPPFITPLHSLYPWPQYWRKPPSLLSGPLPRLTKPHSSLHISRCVNLSPKFLVRQRGRRHADEKDACYRTCNPFWPRLKVSVAVKNTFRALREKEKLMTRMR